jgi:glycerol-3-phosphate dehydrogenase
MLRGQKLQVKQIYDAMHGELLCSVHLISLILQGVSTAREVYGVLTYRGWQELFPLLSTVHEICIGQLPPTSIVEYSEHTPNLSLIGGPTPFY